MIEEGFYDGGVFVGVDGGYFYGVGEEGEVFEGDGFVFVVVDYVVYYEGGGKGCGGGGVVGEVEVRGVVVGCVYDVEGVGLLVIGVDG